MRLTVESLQAPESSEIIDELTTPAIETVTGNLIHESIPDDETLLKKAIAIRDLLNVEVESAFEQVRQRLESRTGIPQRLRLGELYQLEYHVSKTPDKGWAMVHQRSGTSNGLLYLNCGWLNDIARNMIRNRPVEVEVAQPNDRWLSRRPMLSPSYNAFEKQVPGFQIGALLNRIQGLDYVRPIAVVNDMPQPDSEIPVSSMQAMAVSQAYGRLIGHKAITLEDQPGVDFAIIPYSRYAGSFDEIASRIEDAESGFIAKFTDERVYLRPNDRIQESVSRQFNAKVAASDERNGVLLRQADGHLSSVALAAATFMNPVNTKFTHLRLHEQALTDCIGREIRPVHDDQQISTLLQAMDISHPDRDHNIYYDANQRPENIVYAFAYLLRREVQKIVDSLQSLHNVEDAMKPADYFDHNYNDEAGIWPEDQQGLSALGSELPLHYSPGDIESAAVIGYGPFSYPALAIAAFMKEDGIMDISDLLPGNIDFAQEWFSDTASQGHTNTYTRFADKLRESKKSGRFYQDCEAMLRKTARLHVAPLEELPSDSAQVVAESFVSCSNNIEKYGFYETIRQKARILKWTNRSMMISVHMVESGGWNNSGDHEGIKIPAAKLTADELQDGYRSAGLRILRAVPLHADASIREEYSGMFLVFAKPDTIDKPQSIPR